MSKRRDWTISEINELKELYPMTHTAEIAKELNRTHASVATKATSLGLKRDKDYLNRQKMESGIYMMYRGDDLLVTGTLEEIAEHQNMTVGNVKFMTYPSYHKRSESEGRRLVFKLEEDLEDDM